MDDESGASSEPLTTEGTEGTIQTPGEPSPWEKEAAKLKADFEQKLEEGLKKSASHFQSLSNKQSAEYQRQADMAKRRAESAEAQLSAVQQQVFNNLDSDQKVDYLTRKVQELETGRTGRQFISEPQQQVAQGPTIEDGIKGFLSAQGVNPDDKRVDWDKALSQPDMLSAMSLLGANVAKIKEEDLQNRIQEQIDKVKKSARAEIEKEHEVGEYAKVEIGAVPSGKGRGNVYKRGDIQEKMKNPILLTKEERAEFTKAFDEGRVYE